MHKAITERVRERDRSKIVRRGRFEFNHGLGDAVMLRSMLKHYGGKMELFIPPEARYHRLFDDCENVDVIDEKRPGPRYYFLRFFPESHDCKLVSGPKIKPRICLEVELNTRRPCRIVPEPLDMSHVFSEGVQDTLVALQALSPYVVFHGQGMSDKANAPKLWLCQQVCRHLADLGINVLVLNYDYSNSRFTGSTDFWFVGQPGIYSTFGWPLGVECMWTVLKYAQAFVGIDSGPLHLALTIPELPIAWIKKRLDFKAVFYDGGLDAIESVIDEDKDSVSEIKEKVERLLK